MNITVDVQAPQDGFAPVTLRTSSGVERQLDLAFEVLQRHYDGDDPVALDFLLLGSLCYVTDKMVKRRSEDNPDHWTRRLELSVPVSDPALWRTAKSELEEALGFLTGDLWDLDFVPLPCPLYIPTKRKAQSLSEPADAVRLFSGGLDSLAGSIDLLAQSKRVLLVSHHDGAAPEQNVLVPALQSYYPGFVRSLRMRIGHRSAPAPETTLRSRSLLFIALGMYAARSLGPNVPIVTPENGVIALNVPLTPSRAGSCSTRTMHPRFLSRLKGALQKVGLTNPLSNPLELQTKGEVLLGCRNAPLLKQLASQSASCSHPTRRQIWVRKNNCERNCGYCMPCLFRRASMNAAGWDDGNDYGLDVCRSELLPTYKGSSANDLRAMLSVLRARKTEAHIERDILRVAQVGSPALRAKMVARGYEEVRALFRAKGDPTIRRAAGV